MTTQKDIIGITLMMPLIILIIYLLLTNILIQLTAILLLIILLFGAGISMFLKEDITNDESGDIINDVSKN